MNAADEREPPILVADHTPLKKRLAVIPASGAKTAVIRAILQAKEPTDE